MMRVVDNGPLTAPRPRRTLLVVPATGEAAAARPVPQDLVPGDGSRLGRVAHGVEPGPQSPAVQCCYRVYLPVPGLGGSAHDDVRARSQDDGERRFAFAAEAPVSVTLNRDRSQYIIELRTEPFEAHAAKLTGARVGERIQFDARFELLSGAGRALMATVGFVHSELSRAGGISSMPAARHELENLLMTQLLATIPNQLSPLLYSRSTRPRRAGICNAIDFIHRDPVAAVTLSTEELADMVNLSVRILQAGFQNEVGMSPTAYLRAVRLDRVRQELLLGADESVTDVAARWSFHHPGRFARQYRDRFGELPSDTWRRHFSSSG
jgi:AraC-like DNA-binding protein